MTLKFSSSCLHDFYHFTFNNPQSVKLDYFTMILYPTFRKRIIPLVQSAFYIHLVHLHRYMSLPPAYPLFIQKVLSSEYSSKMLVNSSFDGHIHKIQLSIFFFHQSHPMMSKQKYQKILLLLLITYSLDVSWQLHFFQSTNQQRKVISSTT